MQHEQHGAAAAVWAALAAIGATDADALRSRTQPGRAPAPRAWWPLARP
jgi:hypothetical protein